MSHARRAEIFYWAAIAIGVVFIVVGGPLARRLELVHMNDFSGVWSGARAIVLGVDPWDPTKYYGFAVDVGTKTPDALVYDYMPWVAFAVAPLALVPLEVAGWIWMIASMICAARSSVARRSTAVHRAPVLSTGSTSRRSPWAYTSRSV